MVGEDQGRAELPERAQPREQQPGADAGKRRRDGHSAEAGQPPVAQRGGDILQGRIDRGEGGTGRDDEKRGCNKDLGEDDADPRFGQVTPEDPADRRVGPTT